MRIENNVQKVLKAVEGHYKLSLKEIIEVEHWRNGVPIAQIAKKCNVNKSTLSYLMYRQGIKGRTAQEYADFKRNQLWSRVNKYEKKRGYIE